MSNTHWTESAEQLALLLNFMQVPGIGPARLRALMARFGSPEAIAGASVHDLRQLDGIDEVRAGMLLSATQATYGQQQIQKLFENQYRLVTYWHREYPAHLKQIDDPPVVLFVHGELLPRDGFAIAVVGTRMPTRYGRLVTERLVADLVEAGVTIVSGLARGVDTIAHAEAVKRGGRTLAVLGSGLDVIYPAENAKLARAITAQGALLTESPFGAKPDAVNFPRRNRIISGLSLGTLVVEAGDKSGALITAKLAADQNREVFAIPGSIFSPRSRGCHALIQEGAKLVTCVEDILQEIPRQRELFARQEFAASLPAELPEEQQRVLSALTREPQHVDVLARKLTMDTGQLLTVLLQLEFQGLARQLPGKFYVRG